MLALMLLLTDAPERTFREPKAVVTIPAPEAVSVVAAFIFTENNPKHRHRTNTMLKYLFKKITSYGKDT